MNLVRHHAFVGLFSLLLSGASPSLPYPHQQNAAYRHERTYGASGQQTSNLQSEKEAILLATNQQRARKRLSPLKPDARLMQAAQQYAERMAAQDQMSHSLEGLSLADKAQRVGYSFRQLSENIALNTRLDGRFVVVEQWMESKGHRQNILTRNLIDIGIGIAGPSRQQRYYYCQLFGVPQ